MNAQNKFRSIDGELTSFRTAWLRAVAHAWSNPSFADELKQDAKGALEALGFEWPWPGLLDLEVKTSQGLQWAGDDWVWPTDKEDALDLYLPLRTQVAPEKRAQALADYYQQRPSIFGTAAGGGSTPRGMSLLNSASIDITDRAGLPMSDFLLSNAPIRFGGRNPPPGGFFPSAGSFLEFEVVLIAAIAKAWDNASFADLLQANVPQPTIALNSIRGYTPAWRLILRIYNDKSAHWDEKEAAWSNLTPHTISLNLPDAPTINDQSVALAAYNSTGAEYPFTCCA